MMNATTNTQITVEATVNAPINKIWNYWSEPAHIMKWNNPSDDWHSPKAENDLRSGGKFSIEMAAKDGSYSFEFGGTYDEVTTHKTIRYTMGDGRKVSVLFTEEADGGVKIVETFDAETINSIEMQRGGWQAILDNFKKYTEAN